jgi:hypothetical protein
VPLFYSTIDSSVFVPPPPRRHNSFYARRRILGKARRDLNRLSKLIKRLQRSVSYSSPLYWQCMELSITCADWYKTVSLPLVAEQDTYFGTLRDHLMRFMEQTTRYVNANLWAPHSLPPPPQQGANESGESGESSPIEYVPQRRQYAQSSEEEEEQQKKKKAITVATTSSDCSVPQQMARRYSAPPVMFSRRVNQIDWPVMPEAELQQLWQQPPSESLEITPVVTEPCVVMARRVTYSGVVTGRSCGTQSAITTTAHPHSDARIV